MKIFFFPLFVYLFVYLLILFYHFSFYLFIHHLNLKQNRRNPNILNSYHNLTPTLNADMSPNPREEQVQTITMPVAQATLAAVLARSAEVGDLDRLESDLRHTRAALAHGDRGSAWQEETRDLLGALAGELSISVRDCRRSGHQKWNAGVFPAYLLHHVARASGERR